MMFCSYLRRIFAIIGVAKPRNLCALTDRRCLVYAEQERHLRVFLPAAAIALTLLSVAASASDAVFEDAGDGAKRHTLSGYVCPAQIGSFGRDAVGQYRPTDGSDYCTYSARDGVYATIVLTPLHSGYDARTHLVPGFIVQEGTGARMSGEGTLFLGPARTLAVYSRIYDAARLETLRYRVQFTGSAVGGWVVETVLEYADPRSLDDKNAFLSAVYNRALQQFTAAANKP